MAKSKEKFNEDWGSVPPQVKQIIYHDLEGMGKPDFCSMRYWEIKVDANGQRVREDKEMILPDDVADEILKVLLNETKWQPVTNRDWYKFVKTPELKGKYD